MSKLKKRPPWGILLVVFIVLSCSIETTTTGDTYRVFTYDLRGAWVPNDPGGIYTGTLLITSDRITITGFSGSQTPSGGDDNKRPFKDFTKGAALRGFSEEGKIYINDRGMLQEGISYIYYTVGSYPKTEFLRFTFAGSDIIMQKQ